MLVQLAHAAIEAGADLIMVSGRPVLGPIEIYRPPGRAPRPIFYGLGNLYWSPEASPSVATPEVYDSIIVRSNVVGSAVMLEIYPVDLRAAGGPAGTPHLAGAERARVILERVRMLSLPFQTTIDIEKYGTTLRGLVRIADKSAKVEPR